MADETKRASTREDERLQVDAEGNSIIECLAGPYRGQYIKVTEAIGNQAIKDNWARIPNQPPFDHEMEVQALTREETDAAIEAANKAAAELRGEAPTPVVDPVPGRTPDQNRAMQPGQAAPDSGYVTKTTARPR